MNTPIVDACCADLGTRARRRPPGPLPAPVHADDLVGETTRPRSVHLATAGLFGGLIVAGFCLGFFLPGCLIGTCG